MSFSVNRLANLVAEFGQDPKELVEADGNLRVEDFTDHLVQIDLLMELGRQPVFLDTTLSDSLLLW
jgi:hypothetical protein